MERTKIKYPINIGYKREEWTLEKALKCFKNNCIYKQQNEISLFFDDGIEMVKYFTVQKGSAGLKVLGSIDYLNKCHNYMILF